MISKKVYLKFVLPTLGFLYVLFLLIARTLYPIAYDDIWETISGLGDPRGGAKPEGAIFFQLAFMILGLLFFMTALTVHSRIAACGQIGWARTGTLWFTIGAIGFFLLGAVRADIGALFIPKLHEISGGIATIGVILAAVSYELALWPEKTKKTGVRRFFSGFARLIIGITGIWFLLGYIKTVRGQTNPAMNRQIKLILNLTWCVLLWSAFSFLMVSFLFYMPFYHLGWYSHDWAVAGVPPIFSFPVWERIQFIFFLLFQGLFVGAFLDN